MQIHNAERDGYGGGSNAIEYKESIEWPIPN